MQGLTRLQGLIRLQGLTRLQGFTRYKMVPSDLFVTVTRFGVTFSVDAVRALNCSRVNVYFNIDKKQMAVKAEKNGDWRFTPDKHNGYVRWNVKHLINKINTLVDTEGKRFIGRYDCDENAIIFDFTISTPTKRR